LRFDIYSGNSDTILSMLIDRTNKKWNKSVYAVDIKGKLELQEAPDWEFIICVFFCLQTYFLFEQDRG